MSLFALRVVSALYREHAFGKLLINIKGTTFDVEKLDVDREGHAQRIDMRLSNGETVITFVSSLDEGPSESMVYGHDYQSDRPFVLVLSSVMFNRDDEDDEEEED